MIINLRYYKKASISIVYVLLSLFLISCSGDLPDHSTDSELSGTISAKQQAPADTVEVDILIRTFQNEDQSWGYDIYQNGNRYIHQPHIPAAAGIKGFQTELSARKVAGLVVKKIKNGMMPPSVSTTELDSVLRE